MQTSNRGLNASLARLSLFRYLDDSPIKPARWFHRLIAGDARRSNELLKLDQVAIRIAHKKAVNAELFEPVRRLVDFDAGVAEPAVTGVHVVGDERNHAASRFDHAIGKGPANTDRGAVRGGENPRAALVANAFQTEFRGIKIRRRIQFVRVNPANLPVYLIRPAIQDAPPGLRVIFSSSSIQSTVLQITILSQVIDYRRNAVPHYRDHFLDLLLGQHQRRRHDHHIAEWTND